MMSYDKIGTDSHSDDFSGRVYRWDLLKGSLGYLGQPGKGLSVIDGQLG